MPGSGTLDTGVALTDPLVIIQVSVKEVQAAVKHVPSPGVPESRRKVPPAFVKKLKVGAPVENMIAGAPGANALVATNCPLKVLLLGTARVRGRGHHSSK